MEKLGITEREAYIANNAEAYKILQDLVDRYIEDPTNATALPVLIHAQRMINGVEEPGRKEAIAKALKPFVEMRSPQKNRQ